MNVFAGHGGDESLDTAAWSHGREFLPISGAVDVDAVQAELERTQADTSGAELLRRVQLAGRINDARFQYKSTTFTQQYSHLYFARLGKLRSVLQAQAKQRWGSDCPLIDKVLDVREGQTAVVVGTLYKEMKLKPSVFKELAAQRALVPEVVDAEKQRSLVGADDFLVLEDMSGRIPVLAEPLLIESLPSGIIVALRGTSVAGELQIDDVCVAGPAPQRSLPAVAPGGYVALVSGLHIGAAQGNPLPLQLFLDWLSGHAGSTDDAQASARVARVILAGESLCQTEAAQDEHAQRKRSYGKQGTVSVAPVADLDAALAQVAPLLHVDVMPGAGDPSSFVMPQQAMRKFLFPHSSQYPSVALVSNPHDVEVGGVHFLGTSGQPLHDLDRYLEGRSPLQLLEDTLRWRHLAPTAPDTLGCFPFVDSDPFIMEETPHVYFAGNQDSFATKAMTLSSSSSSSSSSDAKLACRLIALPRFADTGTVVLVNLDTLNCVPMTFSCEL